MVAPARGKAGGFEGPQGAVPEAGEKKGRIVDGHPALFPGLAARGAEGGVYLFRKGPLPYEGRVRPDDLGDVSYQVMGEVDDVGVQVSVRPGAGLALLQPPDERKFRIDDPVLEVNGAPVVDLAEAALVDDPPRQGHRGDAPVVVGHHVLDLGFLHRGEHGPGFGKVVGQRFLAEQVLAVLGRGDGDVGMGVPRRGHVDEVDVLTLHQTLPARFDLLPAELIGRGLHGLLVAAAKGFHHRHRPGIGEEEAHVLVGVAVGLAHELVADESDVDLFRHGELPGRGEADSPSGWRRGTCSGKAGGLLSRWASRRLSIAAFEGERLPPGTPFRWARRGRKTGRS